MTRCDCIVFVDCGGPPGILGLLQQFPGHVQLWLRLLQHTRAIWKIGCQVLQLIQLPLQGIQAKRQLGFQDPVTHLLDLGQVGGRV